MSNPSVLFVSACKLKPDEVINKVLNSSLTNGNIIDENITAYEWHIDNKYYNANINLCSVKSESLSNTEFTNTVEAVVICFDGISCNLSLAESWLPFLTLHETEIRILVCEKFHGDDAKRSPVVKWCCDNEFELVELYPNLEELNDDEDFIEIFGIQRIQEALNAHQWPNLVLKSDENNENRARPSQIIAEAVQDCQIDDSFGDLFFKLAEIKNHVKTLSGDARSNAAEHYVRALWKAMGDDDDVDEEEYNEI